MTCELASWLLVTRLLQVTHHADSPQPLQRTSAVLVPRLVCSCSQSRAVNNRLRQASEPKSVLPPIELCDKSTLVSQIRASSKTRSFSDYSRHISNPARRSVIPSIMAPSRALPRRWLSCRTDVSVSSLSPTQHQRRWLTAAAGQRNPPRKTDTGKKGPLSGIRVLDMTRVLAGVGVT